MVDHFATALAIWTIPGAAVDNAPAPEPPSVNFMTPDAKDPRLVAKSLGTVTPDHFLTESAN